LHRSSSNSSSAWITRAYTLQPKSLKSITTRHDGTKRNTRNTTQNAIHANRDACKIDHDTSRFRWFCCSFGSVGFRWVPLDSVVPLGSVRPLGSVVLLGSVVPLGSVRFRWVPLGSVRFRCSFGFRFSVGFRWVPLFLWVPLVPLLRWLRWVPLIFAVPLVPLFRWFPVFRLVPFFRWFRWFPLFCWVPLFRWVPLFSLVPLFRWVALFFSYKSIPTRHDGNTAQHNTTKQLKTRRSAAEAVACKSGHRALVAREGP